MKRKFLNLIVFSMFFMTFCITKVSAGISASKTSIKVGESITIKPTAISNGQKLNGTFRVTSSDSSKLSGSTNISFCDSDTGCEGIKFTAKSSGTVTITATPGTFITSDAVPKSVQLSSSSVTIRITSKATTTTSKPTTTKPSTPTKPKSSVNNLKSLVILFAS